jgi:hypothetical protein
MNKLKENIFGVAVGGCAVGLLILGYFLVFRPLQTLGARQTELDARLKDLKTLNDPKKTKFVPNQPYSQALEARKEADAAALKEGEAYYTERTKPFQLYFNDAPSAPDPATFVSTYETQINQLVAAYREKFQIAAAVEGNPEEVPPVISKMDLAGADDAKRAAAMKEFWFIHEVLTACMELELGGLLSVGFPGRGTADKYAHEYYGTVLCEVLIDLPFSRKEVLLTKLLESKRVPFVIESLVMRKRPEDLGRHQSMERIKDFKQGEDHKKGGFDDHVPEPNVSVTIRLLGFDWKGIPEAAPEKEKEDPKK